MAGQQVSAEDALPFFRQRCSELQDENILLRARGAALEQRAADLEKQLAEAQQHAPAQQYNPADYVEPDASQEK